jgi:hypothetical protein
MGSDAAHDINKLAAQLDPGKTKASCSDPGKQITCLPAPRLGWHGRDLKYTLIHDKETTHQR